MIAVQALSSAVSDHGPGVRPDIRAEACATPARGVQRRL